MLRSRLPLILFLIWGFLSSSKGWSQDRPPYFPGGTRLTVAAEICFAPFSSEDFDRCLKFLINGDYNLANDVEFLVLKNFVILANTVFDPEVGIYRATGNIQRTMELFSRIEGVNFASDLLSDCGIRYVNIGGVAFGRNDGEYLGCVQRYIVDP